MSVKDRSEDQTAISVSLAKALLAQADERVESLGINRSLYVSSLMRNDLTIGGPLQLMANPRQAQEAPAARQEQGGQIIAASNNALPRRNRRRATA